VYLKIIMRESILKHIENEGKFVVDADGAKANVVKEHLIITRNIPAPYQETAFRGGFLYLNKQLTHELEAEGFSREVMRRIQSLRKKGEYRREVYRLT